MLSGLRPLGMKPERSWGTGEGLGGWMVNVYDGVQGFGRS